jgi:hypothetical protein
MSRLSGEDPRAYVDRITREEIGKKVRTLDNTVQGTIIDGSLLTGQWVVQLEDGSTRTLPGCDLLSSEA